MGTTILTAEDVMERVPARTLTQLLARDGGSTLNTAFRDRMVRATNSFIAVQTRGAFPNGLVADGHAPDDIFVEWACDIFCFIAASKHNNASLAEPHKDGYEAAKANFKALTKGQDPAPVTSGTSAEPIASEAASAALEASDECAETFWGSPHGSTGFGGAGGF